MKYAFLADIHGNFDALQAVLQDIEDTGGVDRICCTGDVVGYGAQPCECLALVRESGWPLVAGNHDYAACGMTDISYFNPVAREAIEWTAGVLSEEEKDFLASLPLVFEEDNFVMVHGTLYEPQEFGYVLSELDARIMLNLLKKDFCFTGHSHYPCIFVESGGLIFTRDLKVKIGIEERAIINVGSVGQSRDGDPRACWVMYDEEARIVTTRRVEYDIDEAARKIDEAELPEPLSDRLFEGA